MIMAMPNVKMLLGNHEYMMLVALTAPKTRSERPWERNFPSRDLRLWYSNGGRVTHDYWKHIRKTDRQEVIDFLESLPLNIDVEVNGKKYKLVHGSPLENYESSRRYYDSIEKFAVWERWSECDYVPEGYILVFGHTPTINFHDDNPLTIWHSDEAIGIDCGSGFPAKQNAYLEKGRLACLRLDDMKEFYSE
jgi:serine/threonine protein phosphatase 1